MDKNRKDPLALTEDTAKCALLLKGKSSSQVMNDVLLDLTLMTKPNCKALNRNNDILPFEDVNSLEFLGQKNKSALFALVSHTKKRPNNLVMVR
jgi:ribosome production factor 2